MYEKIGVAAPAWIELDAVIRKAFAAIPHREIILESNLEGFRVYADPLFEKVFTNLLDNAVRHGDHVSRIHVSAQELDTGLVLVWEDDGIGIEEDEKVHIFERGVGKNTGMGLFLAREILTITGMTIHETGKPGKGARFEITIPNGGYQKGLTPCPVSGSDQANAEVFIK